MILFISTACFEGTEYCEVFNKSEGGKRRRKNVWKIKSKGLTKEGESSCYIKRVTIRGAEDIIRAGFGNPG